MKLTCPSCGEVFLGPLGGACPECKTPGQTDLQRDPAAARELLRQLRYVGSGYECPPPPKPIPYPKPPEASAGFDAVTCVGCQTPFEVPQSAPAAVACPSCARPNLHDRAMVRTPAPRV